MSKISLLHIKDKLYTFVALCTYNIVIIMTKDNTMAKDNYG